MTLPQRISEDLARRILDLELVASEALSTAAIYREMLSEALVLLQAQQAEAAQTRNTVLALKDEIQRYVRAQVFQ